MMDLSQFKQKFIGEAETLLTNLDNALIELEKDPGNKQHIDEAFRVMHSIKGASGMFGFDKIVEITHELESLFDIARENKLQVPQSLVEVTFVAADHIRALLKDGECIDLTNIQQHSTLKENIEKLKRNFEIFAITVNTKEAIKDNQVVSGGAQPIKKSWNILFYPDEDIIRRAINLIYTFQDLFQLGDYRINNCPFHSGEKEYWSIFLVTDMPYEEIENALVFVLDYCKIIKIANFNIFDPSGFEYQDTFMTNEACRPFEPIQTTPIITMSDNTIPIITNPSTSNDTTTPVFNKQTTTHINVNAVKLDTLMYLVSELVTAKSELSLALQKQNIEKATDTAEKIEKLAKLFSENALSIRLVSLFEMLNRFKRLIRDLSKQLGKSIDFVTIGEDTELDKNIIDNIAEPIMHLIRNCIDHGIETPDKRFERGKPEVGIIKFEAIKSGNYVYISISDDGNGINTEYVYNKAVEKGFIKPNTDLSQKEIFDLIFLPGFSTAQSLTKVSGRGVGMDIVSKKIQEIRGEISTSSNVGVGTTFTLKLQQTISIIETLLIQAAGYTYAIPVEDIESCILEDAGSIIDKHNKQIGYNDNLIPFINLRNQFGQDYQQIGSVTEKLIIINRLDKVYAIVADNIIGEYQAVIKPLGNAFTSLKFFSGASLLGDGSIALLLDTDKLWYEIIA